MGNLEESEQKFVDAYARLGSYRKAGKECRVRDATIKAAVLKSGVKIFETAAQLRAANLKRCAFCKQVFPRSEEFFARIEKISGNSYCRSCSPIRASIAKNANINSVLCVRLLKAKNRSRRSSCPFTLTIVELQAKWHHQNGLCFYTKRPMTYGKSEKKWASDYSAVSLDRINPVLGYTNENVVLCCSIVNTMKSNMTIEQMLDWANAISNFGGR